MSLNFCLDLTFHKVSCLNGFLKLCSCKWIVFLSYRKQKKSLSPKNATATINIPGDKFKMSCIRLKKYKYTPFSQCTHQEIWQNIEMSTKNSCSPHGSNLLSLGIMLFWENGQGLVSPVCLLVSGIIYWGIYIQASSSRYKEHLYTLFPLLLLHTLH